MQANPSSSRRPQIGGLGNDSTVAGGRGPKGAKGDKGDQGDQGVQGDQGIQGNDGPQGLQGEQGNPGADGTDGEQGIQGIQGPPGDKTAIVRALQRIVKMFCAEATEPLFSDVLHLTVNQRLLLPVDPLFVDMVEEGSLFVRNAVPANPAMVGASIVNSPNGPRLSIRLMECDYTAMTVEICGVRKGHAGRRFESATEAEMLANEKWYGMARNLELMDRLSLN